MEKNKNSAEYEVLDGGITIDLIGDDANNQH